MVMERLLLVGVQPKDVAEVKLTKGTRTLEHIRSSADQPPMLTAGELLEMRSGGRAGMLLELHMVVVGDPVVLCVQLTDDAPADSKLEALASYRKLD
jgi:hypothetical protein